MAISSIEKEDYYVEEKFLQLVNIWPCSYGFAGGVLK
jgi:hypothetical protein